MDIKWRLRGSTRSFPQVSSPSSSAVALPNRETLFSGIVSSHVHAVVGGSAFNVNYDPLEYRNASCTSIETPVDKSNYWMPAVYGRSGNTFSALPVREIRIYYFTEGSVAFP